MYISSNFNSLVKKSYHFELSPTQYEVAKFTLVISLIAAACFLYYKAYQFTKNGQKPVTPLFLRGRTISLPPLPVFLIFVTYLCFKACEGFKAKKGGVSG